MMIRAGPVAAISGSHGYPGGPVQAPKLLAQPRAALLHHQLSQRTEQAYLAWVRRYVQFQGLRHPAELGEADLVAFVSELAVEGRQGAG